MLESIALRKLEMFCFSHINLHIKLYLKLTKNMCIVYNAFNEAVRHNFDYYV